MGSRIIHLIISKNIAKSLGLNSKRFNFGNLLPDAHTKEPGAKERSHFNIPGSKLGDGKYIDYEYFLQKYNKRIKDEVYLGYYSHLIADELWLKDVYGKYMLDENNNIKKELGVQYYRDYGVLNKMLIDKYGLKLDVEETHHTSIEEVDYSTVSSLLGDLNSDFKGVSKQDKLVIFQESDIITYISKAIVVATEKIKEINPNYF